MFFFNWFKVWHCNNVHLMYPILFNIAPTFNLYYTLCMFNEQTSQPWEKSNAFVNLACFVAAQALSCKKLHMTILQCKSTYEKSRWTMNLGWNPDLPNTGVLVNCISMHLVLKGLIKRTGDREMSPLLSMSMPIKWHGSLQSLCCLNTILMCTHMPIGYFEV